MPPYKVQLTHQAEKAFEKLMKSQPHMAKHVAAAIDDLSLNPTAGIPLKGTLKGCYKYRVGPYRIIYQIERALLIITVIDIGDRKEVYR